MGYYPPYIPDAYLTTMNYVSLYKNSIQKVQRIQKKDMQHHPKQPHINERLHIQWKRYTGKGNHVDYYA